MPRKPSQKALQAIKVSEGLRLKAYQDGGGVWTIGWGHTKGVRRGMVITQPEALVFLSGDAEVAAEAVNRLVRVPLSQHQFDALVDFVFNIGEPEFKTSTLLRVLNMGQYDAVPAELRRWKYDNGEVFPGLVARREREIELWNTPDDKDPQPPAAVKEAA